VFAWVSISNINSVSQKLLTATLTKSETKSKTITIWYIAFAHDINIPTELKR